MHNSLSPSQSVGYLKMGCVKSLYASIEGKSTWWVWIYHCQATTLWRLPTRSSLVRGPSVGRVKQRVSHPKGVSNDKKVALPSFQSAAWNFTFPWRTWKNWEGLGLLEKSVSTDFDMKHLADLITSSAILRFRSFRSLSLASTSIVIPPASSRTSWSDSP